VCVCVCVCDEAHQASYNQLQYEIKVSPECCIHSQDTETGTPENTRTRTFPECAWRASIPPVDTSEVKPAAEVVETEVDALN
jgi:hypothetical protein